MKLKIKQINAHERLGALVFQDSAQNKSTRLV